MDDNTTQIILAFIALVSVIATGVIGLFTLRATQKAAAVSLSNSAALAEVAKKVDGITTERIKSASDLGDANAEIARGAGRDEERAKHEQQAASAPVVAIEPTKVAIVESVIVPVEVKTPTQGK